MFQADVGLIGLAVMGQNLALNIQRNGYKISVYNRTNSKTEQFIKNNEDKANLNPSYSLEEFVASLKRPRKIITMVQAGRGVEDLLSALVPLLQPNDIVIDGGNSYFKDTIRRTKELQYRQVFFMGVGISGGEEGALMGASIMPGGDFSAWQQVKEILLAVAAKTKDGSPCCGYIGNDGAGHFVKMVHNGIEYADMQLISEAYFLLKELVGLKSLGMADIFQSWNKGVLDSYLIEITADILKKIDGDTGRPLVELILDKAGQKGTGMWTAREALELGSCAPTIIESVMARNMSALKEERVLASESLYGVDAKEGVNVADLVDNVKNALYASKICAYAQGFDILKRARDQYGWSFNLGEISLLWREGCIIRAQFLEKINEAYNQDAKLTNLMMAPYFTQTLNSTQQSLRFIVSEATKAGLPIPAFSSALSYFDAYRRKSLPANLIQAQRDYFGAHTYERKDKAGIFHTEWKD